MRYAILSDIHGNLEALQAVLQKCLDLQVRTILCAGDIVGYGANPVECLQWLKQARAVCVAGNHDWATSGKLDASYFTDDGQAAIAWTRAHLFFDELQWINTLPLTYHNQHLQIVHSSPFQPERFDYLTTVTKANKAFSCMQAPLCFLGHTHVPRFFVLDQGQVVFFDQEEMEIFPERKYLVNVGSVGQPRDGNPMASFCVYDTDAGSVRIHRQPYDIARAQQKIIDAGLPKFLAERLSRGE